MRHDAEAARPPGFAGPVHRLKLGLLRAASGLPGALGQAAARRYFYRRQRGRAPAVLAAFERALARLSPGDVCLDLGANVGDVTERMRASGAEVHAVEPDPWAFARLSERFAGIPGVHLHNAAIGIRDGSVAIRRDPGVADNPRLTKGSTVERRADWDGGETVEVPEIDIRRLLREIDRPVAIAKIDIEGAEVALLEALAEAPERARIGEIFVETHELMMPHLRPATAALRRRLAGLDRPRIHFDWP